jgi:hypothetical protein
MSPLRRILNLLDFLVFTAAGLAGWLIVFLWFFTDHTNTQSNWNLVWAIPFHFPLALLFFFNVSRKWISFYLRFTAVLAIFGLLGYFALPQTFNTDLIPLLLIIAFRATAGSMRFKPARDFDNHY